MAEDTTNTGAKMDELLAVLFPDLSGFSFSSCRQCSFGFRDDYVASLGMLNEILTILGLVQCTRQH